MARAKHSYQSEDHTIASSDGSSNLFVRHFYRGKPKIHFLIVHGALEHSARHFEQIMFWFKNYNQDIAVTIYDHVGHGRSGGARAFVPSFDVYVKDLKLLGEFVKSKNSDETKNFICAHSMGGLITLLAVLDPSQKWELPIQGLIFSSPCIKPHLALGQYSEPLLAKLDVFMSKLHLPMIYKGSDLTRDPARANDFDTDPLIPKFMTVRMAKTLIEACHELKGLSYYLKIPSLFFIAGEDKIVDSESATLFAHGIDKQLTEVIQYTNHHHEIWNEIDREDTFNKMKKWVDARLKESP